MQACQHAGDGAGGEGGKGWGMEGRGQASEVTTTDLIWCEGRSGKKGKGGGNVGAGVQEEVIGEVNPEWAARLD